MSQCKTIQNLSLLLSLMFCLSLTGCATLAVDQFIHHPRSQFVDEFTPLTKEVAGTYSGIERINDHSYARITVLPNSSDCKERPVIELLLPMEKSSDTQSTLRIGKSTKELPTEDKYIGQPVKIVFYTSSNDKEINIDKSMTLLLSGQDWRGYPSVVVVGYKKGGSYIDKLAYKTIPEGSTVDVNDFLVRPFNCNALCHKAWACKNKENNLAGIMLKPFSVVLDIVTAPVQFLGALVIVSVYGF